MAALLALKLRGIGRSSQAMAEVFDPGPALFDGLNAFPKRATLTEYTSRIMSPSAPSDRTASSHSSHGMPRPASSATPTQPSENATRTTPSSASLKSTDRKPA